MCVAISALPRQGALLASPNDNPDSSALPVGAVLTAAAPASASGSSSSSSSSVSSPPVSHFPVYYSPSVAAISAGYSDSFNYTAFLSSSSSCSLASSVSSVQSVQGSVSVLRYSLSSPASKSTVQVSSFNEVQSISEMSAALLILGGTHRDGTQAIAQIVSLPSAADGGDPGALYHPGLTAGATDVMYTSFSLDPRACSPAPCIPVTSVPTTALSTRGVFLYQAGALVISKTAPTAPRTVTFSYAWLHPITGERTPPATVTIHITPVNRAPQPSNASAVYQQAQLTPAQLSNASLASALSAAVPPLVISMVGSKPDYSAYPHLFTFVDTFPTRGQLLQVDANGNAVPLAPVPAKSVLPVVSSWLTGIMDASSQYSNCGPACTSYLGCLQTACTTFIYGAVVMLGPPDCYPSYGDCSGGYNPAVVNSPLEWVEAEIEMGLYVTSISLYETQGVGSVTRIAGATTYAGANTQ
jgi:hypothetical protein